MPRHRRITLLTTVALFLPALLMAQDTETLPRFEIHGGYVTHDETRFDSDPVFNGFVVSGARITNVRWDLVGEVAGGYRSTERTFSEPARRVSIDQSIYSFAGGPRFSWRRPSRVVPFVQLLAGVVRLAGESDEGDSKSEVELGIQPGAGVDISFEDHVALRLGLDLLLSSGDNEDPPVPESDDNWIRFHVGIVVRGGAR